MKKVISEAKEKFIAQFSGKSMQPTLKDGMLLLVEKITPLEAKLADIILYQNGKSLVAHRLIRIFKQNKKRIFVMRGDNHAYIDVSFIPEDNLVGRVILAFTQDNPMKNLLIKNRIVELMYIITGNLLFWTRKNRKYIPFFLRLLFKPFVGSFFLILKKITHFLYLLSR